jgi:hypothetical protein
VQSSGPDPHPEPPDDLPARSLPTFEQPGPWIRIHQIRHQPIHFGRSGYSRFDAPAGEYGVLYAGSDAHCAFVETFGQSTGARLVTTSALQDRAIARIVSARPLRLVDLTGSGLARIGADERLCAGDHCLAQRWALAMWRHPSAPDGLLYRARHDPSRLAVALFDRVRTELTADPVGSLADPSLADLLGAILDTYGFGLV